MAEATKQHAMGRIEVDSYEPKPLGGEGGFTADLGQGAEITLDYRFE